jgi:hypothetical protein
MICNVGDEVQVFAEGVLSSSAKAEFQFQSAAWERRVNSGVANITVSLSINTRYSELIHTYIHLRLCTSNQVPSSKRSIPHVVTQSHVIFPEIQELMLPTISTTRAAKWDRVARGQHHSGKVMSDWYKVKQSLYTPWRRLGRRGV